MARKVTKKAKKDQGKINAEARIEMLRLDAEKKCKGLPQRMAAAREAFFAHEEAVEKERGLSSLLSVKEWEELEKSDQQEANEKERRQRHNEVEHEIMAKMWAEREVKNYEEALEYYRYEISFEVAPVLEMGKHVMGLLIGAERNDLGCYWSEEDFNRVIAGLAASFGHCQRFIRRLDNETDSAYLRKLPGELKTASPKECETTAPRKASHG